MKFVYLVSESRWWGVGGEVLQILTKKDKGEIGKEPN